MTRFCFIAAILGFLLYAGSAYAQCTITTTPVSFGPYDVLSATPLPSNTGTITISCGNNKPVVVDILQSMRTSTFARQMWQTTPPTDKMDYNLYTDNTYTAIWGDGSSGTSNVTVQAKNPVTLTIYGRIPALQNMSIGDYNDQVVARVTF